jgi:ribosomal protein S18 acetylase RimI-like enzyme
MYKMIRQVLDGDIMGIHKLISQNFTGVFVYTPSMIEKLVKNSYIIPNKGFILMTKSLLYGGDHNVTTVACICVDEQHRGQGIGKTLLNQVIKTNKYSDIYLHVKESNFIAQKLYTSSGFKSINLIPNYYTDVQPPETAIYMVKLGEKKIEIKF